MASRKDILQRIDKQVARLAELTAQANAAQLIALQQIRDREAEAIAKATLAHDREIERVEAEYRARRAEIDAMLGEVQTRVDAQYSETDWAAPQWPMFRPNMADNLETPHLSRIGMFTETGQHGQIQMPALAPIIGGQNFVIKASGAGKERGRALLQSLMLRLLAAVPVGKLRLTCVDPIGLGGTVAGFIKGLPDNITGGQAWFSATDIESQLGDLENRSAFIRQKYLGVSYGTLEAYNQDAGQIEEPYRLLVVSDFPARFTDTAAQRLLSIATNGPSTGIYIALLVDLDQQLPHNFVLADIERTATVITVDSKRSVYVADVFSDCQLDLDPAPPVKVFEKVMISLSEGMARASGIRVPWPVPPPAQRWSLDSRAGIRVPLGQFGAREMQNFEFNEGFLNSALVIGQPGSGKSTALHALINGIAFYYSPNEVELYLLDFKQVEFKDYADFRLPHARVVAIKSEREFGLSVLRGLLKELARRKDLFGNMASLSEYRTKTGERLPRVVLIADEFQELFSYDDALATESNSILDAVVRQGRAFGINVILATQTLSGSSISASTRNQIPLRLAFRCSETDSRQALGDDNDRARLLERPGEGIYNPKNGEVAANNRFQGYWISSDDRKVLQGELQKTAASRPEFAKHAPMVFDGSASADISSNSEFQSMLAKPAWNEPKRGMGIELWLGEPIEVKNATTATLRRQSRSNLLIVGQRDYAPDAAGLISSALMSAANQYDPANLSMSILNPIDIDSHLHELPRQIRDALPHEVTIAARRDLPRELGRLAKIVVSRRAEESAKRWPIQLIALMGLHNAYELLRDDFEAAGTAESDIGTEAAKPTANLLYLLRNGPDVGVHSLIWCDNLRTLQRASYLRWEDEFAMRIAFAMDPEESSRLVGSRAAGNIGARRAMLFDEERNVLEKFRPFAVPDQGWFDLVGICIAARG